MTRYTYKPMDEAPKDGTPIIAVCGGGECAVAYDDGAVLQGWFYWDEEEGGMTYERVRGEPSGWRDMF